MSHNRLYRKVAQHILNLINSGAFPQGSKLPGERALSEKYGVSRVVVREAQISLEALGKLEIRAGSGVYVSEESDVNGLIPVNITPFELTQTRLLFEPECAALAATRITEAQLDALRKTIDRMAKAPGNSADGEQADKDFHFQIAGATANVANVFFLKSIWRMRTEVEAVRKVYQAVCVEDPSHRVKEHTTILDALVARDPIAARQAMRGHFERLFEALLDASERQAIEEAIQRSSAYREQYLSMAAVAA